jgi:hypothetical protein
MNDGDRMQKPGTAENLLCPYSDNVMDDLMETP